MKGARAAAGALRRALPWAVAAAAGGAAALAVVNAVAWPRIGRDRRRSETAEAPVDADAPAPAGGVAVLVPARDEEANLPACLASVLGQGPEVGSVWVYDDRSGDGTAAVVERVAARDPRVRLVRGGELPAGWCGKPHALARLAEEAAGETSHWLLFLDADARLAPGAVAALVAEARARRADLLAAWPGLTLESPAERLLLPLLELVVLTLYPTPLQLVRSDPALGLAHGACILARADGYRAIGGHRAVADEIFEDTALARAFRAAGLTSLCFDGQNVVAVRMYDSAGAIWRGFRKNFYPAFRRPASFWLFLALHAGVFLAPFPLALLGRRRRPWRLAAGAVLAARAALAVRFRRRWWSVLAHPAAEAVLVALGLASWWSVASGAGVEWKGRRYRGRAAR